MIISSVADPDPHLFGKPDQDPYGNYKSGKLAPDSNPHQSEKQDPDPHQGDADLIIS
jgi:hypothetical protein